MNQVSKKRIKWIVLLCTIVFLALLCFFIRITGHKVHAFASMITLVVIGLHIGKQLKKVKYVSTKKAIVDYIMLISFMIVIISGILLHPMHGIVIIKIIHKLTACIFVIGCVLHSIQHRKHMK